MRWIIFSIGVFAVLLGVLFAWLWGQTKNAAAGLMVGMIPLGGWLIWHSFKMGGMSFKDIKSSSPQGKEENAIVWYANLIEGKPVADRVEFVYVDVIPEGSRPRAVKNLQNKRYHYLKNKPGTNELVPVTLADTKYVDPRLFVNAITMPARTAFNKYIKDDFQMVPAWFLMGVAGLLLLGLIIVP